MTFQGTRFAGVHQQDALTIDAVRHYAPSAFATEAHNSRSDRYTYIPTSTVITALMGEGFQPFKACQSRSRVEGKTEFTKHMIRFRHADTALASRDDSVPEVILINSHDGTSAYKLIAGIFRIVCTNGLVVAESTSGSLSVPHKGNIVDQVIEGSFQIIDQSRKAMGAIESWSNLQLTNGETQAFAEAAHTVRFGESDGEGGLTVETPFTPAQLLAPRRSEDVGSDLWHTFNRVQENAIRGGLRARNAGEFGRRGRRVSTREVKGIDQDVKLNRALWQLAERMAELKTA